VYKNIHKNRNASINKKISPLNKVLSSSAHLLSHYEKNLMIRGMS